jgi:hypothetical protein
MTPDPAHPLADRPAADRLAAFRAVCAVLAGGLVLISVLIGVIVRFALDGQPIAGNGVQVAGLSAVTWVGLAVAGVAPVLALVVAAAQRRSGLAAAADPAAGPDADRDRLLDAFAAAKFAEYAVAVAAGFACSLLYHLTADWVLLAAVLGLAGFLVLRFPTTARAVRWYDEAAAEVAVLRDVAAR